MDLIMLLIKEHEIRGKNAFKKEKKPSQLSLDDFPNA
jgi:hypothetical protein